MAAPAAPRKSLMRKRASRLAAAQTLYARALRNNKKSTAEKLIAPVLASWADSKTSDARDLPYDTQPETAFATKLVATAIEHFDRIEAAIEGIILPQWKKERMSLPLLATLRAFAAETIAYPDRSAGSLVGEYTEVAAQIVSDDEIAYAHKGFNLLLDNLRAAK